MDWFFYLKYDGFEHYPILSIFHFFVDSYYGNTFHYDNHTSYLLAIFHYGSAYSSSRRVVSFLPHKNVCLYVTASCYYINILKFILNIACIVHHNSLK